MACSARPFTDDGGVEGACCVYHVFTDNDDMWTTDFGAAKREYARMVRATHRGRLWVEVYEAEIAYHLGEEPTSEDCLRSYGEYPV